jgi:hypothetical protein
MSEHPKAVNSACECEPRHPNWVSCGDWKGAMNRVLQQDGLPSLRRQAILDRQRNRARPPEVEPIDRIPGLRAWCDRNGMLVR